MTVFEKLRKMSRNDDVEIWSDGMLLFRGYVDEVLDDEDFRNVEILGVSFDNYDLVLHV